MLLGERASIFTLEFHLNPKVLLTLSLTAQRKSPTPDVMISWHLRSSHRCTAHTVQAACLRCVGNLMNFMLRCGLHPCKSSKIYHLKCVWSLVFQLRFIQLVLHVFAEVGRACCVGSVWCWVSKWVKTTMVVENFKSLGKTTQEAHCKPLLNTFNVKGVVPHTFCHSEVNNSGWKSCIILIIPCILIFSTLPDAFVAL